jgi:hypothetical protein
MVHSTNNAPNKSCGSWKDLYFMSKVHILVWWAVSEKINKGPQIINFIMSWICGSRDGKNVCSFLEGA